MVAHEVNCDLTLTRRTEGHRGFIKDKNITSLILSSADVDLNICFRCLGNLSFLNISKL